MIVWFKTWFQAKFETGFLLTMLMVGFTAYGDGGDDMLLDYTMPPSTMDMEVMPSIQSQTQPQPRALRPIDSESEYLDQDHAGELHIDDDWAEYGASSNIMPQTQDRLFSEIHSFSAITQPVSKPVYHVGLEGDDEQTLNRLDGSSLSDELMWVDDAPQPNLFRFTQGEDNYWEEIREPWLNLEWPTEETHGQRQYEVTSEGVYPLGVKKPILSLKEQSQKAHFLKQYLNPNTTHNVEETMSVSSD